MQHWQDWQVPLGRRFCALMLRSVLLSYGWAGPQTFWNHQLEAWM